MAGKGKGGCLKKIVIALVVIVVLGALAGRGGSTSSGGGESRDTPQTNTVASQEETATGDSQQNEQPESQEELEPQEEVQEVYHVGDTLNDGGLKIVYLASGEHAEDNQFLQPDDGYKYVFFKFAFMNESSSDKGISFYSFDGYADGYAVDMYYGGDDDLSATLSAGRTAIGSIYFEVPIDAEEVEAEYSPNMFLSDKITFAYDGEKDSGLVVEPNTSRTPGALSVGETAEGSKVNITFVASEPYVSDNMFIQPREGHHFVSLTLEFENTSDSDRRVSSLSFDCYADGIACDQTFMRDDDLSATISAGRKALGTVTFEVPDDATVIEVEYEDNVWTSNRIVFTAM